MNSAFRTEKSSPESRSAATEDHRKPRVAAVIPCFNEERFIGSVVIKTKKYVDEVVVVDDGSTDMTAMIAEQAGAEVIRHGFNEGKAAAVNSAFERAREAGWDVLILIDGDGQHEPADIPRVLKPVLDGQADIVVGSRFLQINNRIPWLRSLGQRILTRVTNVGAKLKLTDSQSGFRAFSSKAIGILSFTEKGFAVESEMQFRAKEAGLRMAEVPVGVEYHDKAKRSPVTQGISIFYSVVGLISRRYPLVFFGVPGLVSLGFGLWQGWIVLDGYNNHSEFYMGPALLTVLLCSVGSLSIFTGLILYSIRSFFK